MHPIELLRDAYVNYAGYLWRELGAPHSHNYIYWLLAISMLTYSLELIFPWRTAQARLREDFWIDAFYMFWNFFLFPLVGFIALATLAAALLQLGLSSIGWPDQMLLNLGAWPRVAQLLALFLVRDFIHWNVHRLLHRVPWLWRFHQVHHSVQQMGFAAHLRYHWMENVVYRSLQYLPLALIGFSIEDFLLVHLIALSIGHLNHANFALPLGPLRFVFNSSQMHIWHHVKELPPQHPNGINFGISLSVWDYIFGSAYIPHDGRDIELGFPGDEHFPRKLAPQLIYPLGPTRDA